MAMITMESADDRRVFAVFSDGSATESNGRRYNDFADLFISLRSVGYIKAGETEVLV